MPKCLALTRWTSLWGKPVLLLGMGAFSVTVVFQLMNLPVEFDASKRAGRLLVHAGMVTMVEDPVVRWVLQAAALTYVAVPLTALWTRLYCASARCCWRRVARSEAETPVS
ncbi:MAG TPA: zinc metallopeptidase [Candidatus Saccharimonadia bacterium]|nr:zinc metallopeptidase [Candidatus Saccharimonadia bacterium]